MSTKKAVSRETKPEPVPETFGRPSKYKPEYCELLIDHMSKGLSFESFAGVVGTCKQTIYNWTEEFPAFLDAKSQATAKCRLWWEEAGLSGMFMGGKDNPFQSAIWVYNMKCRFRDEWTERKDVVLQAQVQDTTPKESAEETLERLKKMLAD